MTEAKNKEIEALQKEKSELMQQVQTLQLEKYELLTRIYPYLANELDFYRQQNTQE